MKSLKTFGSEEQRVGTGNSSLLPLAFSSLQTPPLLMAIETGIIRLPKIHLGRGNELAVVMNLSSLSFLPSPHPLPTIFYHNGHSSLFWIKQECLVNIESGERKRQCHQ